MQQCCIKNMSELLKHKSIRITDFRIKVLEVFEKHTNAISVKTIENELAGSKIKLINPQGTYQVWFDFSELGFSEEELKNVVFEQAKMGLTPGGWFGAESPHFMRMNIATSRDHIEQSFTALADAIAGFERGSQESSNCCDSGASKSCC